MCPKCAAASDVLETRKAGYLIRRRRLCHNGHRFSTLELPAALVSSMNSRRLRTSLERYSRNAQRFKRDLEIYLECSRGVPLEELATRFGLHLKTVERIARKQRKLRGE